MSLMQNLRWISLALSTCLMSTSAWSQAGGSFEPRVGQAGKDVIWVPTPDAVVNRMLSMAEVGKKDFVVDLGSGDGKIAITAARNLGARAMGLEYNPDMVELSKRRARDAGVEGKTEFRQADIFASDFSKADVVTMYLLPGLNLKLRPILMKMKPGTRVTSHSFDMGSWRADETSSVASARAYLWIVPANVQGNWKLSGSGAGTSLPQELTIEQKFQHISGDASYAGIGASLQDARIRGDAVSFSLRDAQGRMHQLSGRASGNRITGTIQSPGKAKSNFVAERTTPIQSIDES